MKNLLFLLLIANVYFAFGQPIVSEQSIKKGITFLVKLQDKNGFWRENVGYKLRITSANRPHMGISCLAHQYLTKDPA